MTPDERGFFKWTGIVLAVLVVLGGALLWWFFTYEPAFPGKFFAKRDLPAFTLLTGDELEMRGSKELAKIQISDLTDHYLLVAVMKDAEVNREVVVSRQGREWLSDAVTIAIPASITNSLGGQLRIGDTIDLLPVPKTATPVTATQVIPLDNLLVVSVPPPNKDANSSAITLAVPRSKRNDLAIAVSGGTLVLTRSISVSNQPPR